MEEESKPARFENRSMRHPASGVCEKAADQREDIGKMEAGASQAESSGGSTGSAGAPVSRHVGAAGKGSGGLIGSERARNEKKKAESKTARFKNRSLRHRDHLNSLS